MAQGTGRPAGTYRSARRNAARDGAGVQTFVPLTSDRKRAMPAPRYSPYEIKPPQLRTVVGRDGMPMRAFVSRKQPKVYASHRRPVCRLAV